MVDDSHNIRDIHKSVVVHIAFLVFFLNPIEGNRSAGPVEGFTHTVVESHYAFIDCRHEVAHQVAVFINLVAVKGHAGR